MLGLEQTWQLDPRLERDSHFIKSSDVWQTRLINDKRWPWIILVPLVPNAVDLEDLDTGLITSLFAEASAVSQTLKAMPREGQAPISKTNVATIGNVVNQFHLHIVGRHEDDPNWPKPIWGFGSADPYTSQEAGDFIAQFLLTWKETVPLLNRL